MWGETTERGQFSLVRSTGVWVVGREALHGNEPMGYDLWWDRSDVTILGAGFSLVISVWTRRSSSSLRGRSRRHVIASSCVASAVLLIMKLSLEMALFDWNKLENYPVKNRDHESALWHSAPYALPEP